MPSSNHRAETPAPVPISTTFLASTAAAKVRTILPAPGPIATQPISAALARAWERIPSSPAQLSA